MKKKLILMMAVVAAVAVAATGMIAFEAHVINVTATISNVLHVPIDEFDFGTVFPQETPDDKIINIALSQSFIDAVGATSGNLIQNGSFELPEVTNSSGWQLFKSGATGLEWTVEWVNPVSGAPDPALQELQENIFQQAKDGDQYAELDTHNNNGGGLVKIHQDVSTTADKSYTLTYYFAARPGVVSNEITLKIDDVVIETKTANGTGHTTIQWVEYSHTFTAASASTKIEFVGGGTDDTLGVFLDDISLIQERDRLGIVNYVIRQKPKCVDSEGNHPQVTEDASGNFVCPNESTMMPSLCPYLSKHSYEGESEGGLTAFHGLPGPWTLATTELYEVYGRLSVPVEDINDEWNIDLKVPCFEGKCAQDWAEFVTTSASPRSVDPNDYKANPTDEGEMFGCDLWIEVTGIDNEVEPEG